MKLLHAADLHARREGANDFNTAIKHMESIAKTQNVDLIALSGDIWDGPTQNSAGTLFPDFVEAIRSLADCAPVAMIYGTPSHDVEGSLEIFETLASKHGIRILRPGISYILKDGTIQELSGDNHENAQLLLTGIPEPSRKWLLAENRTDSELHAQEILKTLCLALGCMRERYPGLPFVVLAHGQTEGSLTAAGTRLDTDRNLHFSKESLKTLHADYIALGDIHEPQHIEGTRAWYAGSVYPLTYGETHTPGCNLVTIDDAGKPVGVERISFPIPIRKHIISHAACALEIPQYRGERIWYEIRGSRSETALIDTQEVMSRLIGHGADPASRVTIDLTPDTAVRSGEIRKKNGIIEKLKVWAECSGEKLSASLLDKANQLARETSLKNQAPADASYRVDRLILRGAIGIWMVSRKDEIDLNLASCGPSVLALIGKNGAGKTTILENMHPWPRLLTRSGALKTHFRLADSFRDLYMTETLSGWKYRFLITIRADIPTGAMECWIFRDTGKGWEPLPGINGRLEPYEAWISRLFGSLSLYQRTAFTSQKPTLTCPDLANATKGEKKTLFSELCGISWLETYRLEAKAKTEAAAREIERLEPRHSMLKDAWEQEASIKRELCETAERLNELTQTEEALKKDLENAQKEIRNQRELLAEREKLVRQRERAFNAIMSLKARQREHEQVIDVHRASLRKKNDALAILARADSLTREKEQLIHTIAQLKEEERNRYREYSRKLEQYAAERESILGELARIRESTLTDAESLSQKKDTLSRVQDSSCPTCGQQLPSDILATQEKTRGRLTGEITELETRLAGSAARKHDLETTLKNLSAPGYPEVREILEEHDLAKVKEELAQLNTQAAQETVRIADVAEGTITQARQELLRIENEIGSQSDEADRCTEKLAQLPKKETLQQAENQLEQLTGKLSDTTMEKVRIQTKREQLEQSLAATMRQAEEYQRLTQTLADLTRDLCEWAQLERATGKDGIQALELDALAPSIAQTATRLLIASGNQGSIAIQTQKLSGSGSRLHAMEDFSILYIAQDGTEQDISTLSGGEAVWIRKAIYDAFEAIRSNGSGFRMETVIIDEADGSLDPESRLRYIRMIEASHREAGRYQTIIVTHSLELQSMATRCIHVAELKSSSSPKPAAQLGLTA